MWLPDAGETVCVLPDAAVAHELHRLRMRATAQSRLRVLDALPRRQRVVALPDGEEAGAEISVVAELLGDDRFGRRLQRGHVLGFDLDPGQSQRAGNGGAAG